MRYIFLVSLFCCCILKFVKCNELCTTTNASCSYQLWDKNSSEDACQMIYYLRNSPECEDELPEEPKRTLDQKGIIHLMPFVAENESRTVFNITAFNISWTKFKFRFKQQNTRHKCTKREFILKDVVAKDKSLIYDCPWSASSYEDKILDFEYAIAEENYEYKRTFLVHVPKSELIKYYFADNLKHLQLFTYVETTNLYELIFKIQIAPEKLNITDYEIYVHFKNSTVRYSVKDTSNAILGVIDFKHDTYGVPGEYVFSVRPYACNECSLSFSPTVVIPENSMMVTIGIVSATCLIPILLLVLYVNYKIESGFRPRVLLVTTPANGAHKTIATSLSKVLQEKHNIETMLDITDIKTSKTFPTDWLKNSFENATHVVILVSDDKPPTSIYRNMDTSLYRLLEINPKKTCCTLEFPFTKPPKLKFTFHRKFHLMREYNDFINFIRKRGCVHRLKDRLFNNVLFNDLIEQINNYPNYVNDQKPKFTGEESDESSENETKNHEDEDEGDVPENFRKIAEDFALNCDNSDAEEITPHPDVLALLQDVNNCNTK